MIFFIFLLHNFSSGYNCDAQYTKSDGSLTCGFYLNGEFTWHQAIEACQNHGAKLPTIMNDADIQNIIRMKVYFKIVIFKNGQSSQFHQRSTSNFYPHRSQKHKKSCQVKQLI